MTTKSDTPSGTRSIGATIDPASTRRLGRFFDASILEIANEAFQNARRAGASCVNVKVDNTVVRIEDDGCGIDDPEILLAVGSHGWSQQPAKDEKPAGIGFFSLARRRCWIVSSNNAGRTWKAELAPDQFAGKARSLVTDRPSDDSKTGTTIVVELREDESRKDAIQAFLKAARYYPLPVTINRERAKAGDFLSGSVWTVTWENLEIGVKVGPPTDSRINFHGTVARTNKLPSITTLPDNEHQKFAQTWQVAIDILHGPAGGLIVPEQMERTDNNQLAALAKVCERAILQAIAMTSPDSRLSFDTWTLGHKMLEEFPAPVEALERWRPSEAARDWEGPRHFEKPDVVHIPALMAADMNAPDAQALQRAMDKKPGVFGTFYREDDRLKGYSWYDRLPRATAVGFTFQEEDKGEPWPLHLPRDTAPTAVGRRKPKTVTRVRRIRIGIDFEYTDRTRTTEFMNTDLALQSLHVNQDTPVKDLEIILSRDSTIEKAALSELLKLAYFENRDDDPEGDDDGRKEERFDQEIDRIAASVLNQDDADRRNLVSKLGATLLNKLMQGEKVSAHYTSDGQWIVTVQTPTGDADTVHVQRDVYQVDDGSDNMPREPAQGGLRRTSESGTRRIEE